MLALKMPSPAVASPPVPSSTIVTVEKVAEGSTRYFNRTALRPSTSRTRALTTTA
jgi:hypothetical protein